MIKPRSYSICLFLILVFMQACTIEKRRYTGGYHIERTKASKDHISLANKQEEEKQIAPVQVDALPPFVATDSTQLTIDSEQSQKSFERTEGKEHKPTAAQPPKKTQPTKVKSISSNKLSAIYSQGKSTADPEPEEKQKHSALAWVSVGVGLLGILLLFLSINIIQGWAALGYLIMALMVVLISFILGIIALILHKKKGKKIPQLFYVVFVICSIISLWILGGLLASKLGWI